MKTLYQAGFKDGNDGLPHWTQGAIFTTSGEALKVHDVAGTYRQITVFETAKEYSEHILSEKRKKARLALSKEGFTDDEIRKLLP